MNDEKDVKQKKIVKVLNLTNEILAVVIMVAIVGGLLLFKKLGGWYDFAQGPSENYEQALESKDATLASLYDFQFSVNGYYFTLPMRYGDIRDMGFYDYPGTEVVDAKSGVSQGSWFIIGEPNEESVNPLKDRTAIWTDVHNFSDEEMNIDDCQIVAMRIGRFREDGNFENVFPKGIKIGESTMKDVKNAYGKPKYKEKDSVLDCYYYKYEMTNNGSVSYVFMRFDKNNILTEIELHNYRESYGEREN